MTYRIPFTEQGRALYDKHGVEPGLERTVTFLVERMGADNWARRRGGIVQRFTQKMDLNPETTPTEGISLRDTVDEIAWYLYLAETSIANPFAAESDQLSRLMPYMCAFGLKLDAILAVQNVEERITKLLREVENQDPDQGLFELFVAAAYVAEGWEVTALPETRQGKTTDFEIRKGQRRFEVECKRLSRRAEYTTRERDAWLRLWKHASVWLGLRRLAYIFQVDISVEISTLPENYLIDAISKNFQSLATGNAYVDLGVCSIKVWPVDLGRIAAHMAENYVKVASGMERYLLTGRYERDYGMTTSIGGEMVTMGEPSLGGNRYWEEITYAHVALWHCNAAEAIEAKARDIRKRLSEATAQLSGQSEGIVHVGIEAGEGDDVELVRSGKIHETMRSFDPRGKPLGWAYVHFFRGESLPTGGWTIDETRVWFGREQGQSRPLQADFIVASDDTIAREGAHWESAANATAGTP